MAYPPDSLKLASWTRERIVFQVLKRELKLAVKIAKPWLELKSRTLGV
ncbi:hypothetical protein GBAR_LOCUS2822 [Geodia barretti]|uniref:Uncharacterized protein n=1 Tax=Geodia barretti TaxID=519541 RepID=A0AA35R0X3_GEOBA|nr:hypothetical protein GBAR_LOCUS2822 [Geodia barretti]